MSTQSSSHSDHEEIKSMLPWLVNQSLMEGQRATVLNHVEHCEECRREIQFLTSLHETVQNDAQSHYAEHADVEKGLANVMSRIDADEQRSYQMLSIFRQQMGKLVDFATAMTAPQWSAAAMAGLLVALLGFQVFQSQPGDNYSVLSSSDSTRSPMQLSVQLTAPEGWELAQPLIQAKFDKLGRQIEFRTEASGTHIVLLDEVVGVSELSQLIVDLENLELIRQVELLP